MSNELREDRRLNGGKSRCRLKCLRASMTHSEGFQLAAKTESFRTAKGTVHGPESGAVSDISSWELDICHRVMFFQFQPRTMISHLRY